MTGTTRALTDEQKEILLRYADGEPHGGGCPNTNLVRRNFLTLAPTYGPGFYRITEAGYAVASAVAEREVAMDVAVAAERAAFEMRGELAAAHRCQTCEGEGTVPDGHGDFETCPDCGVDWRARADQAEVALEPLAEALSWALDVLEISLKRLDTVEEQPPSDEHLRLRAAGLTKARDALALERDRLAARVEDLAAGDEQWASACRRVEQERDRERARADRAEAALRAHKTGSRESSAADVDGASYDAGHHESVGERQGRQPVLPVRLVIDGNGYVWRDFGEEGVLSMAPSNPDNEPVPEPLTYYVRAALSAGSGGRETL